MASSGVWETLPAWSAGADAPRSQLGSFPCSRSSPPWLGVKPPLQLPAPSGSASALPTPPSSHFPPIPLPPFKIQTRPLCDLLTFHKLCRRLRVYFLKFGLLAQIV